MEYWKHLVQTACRVACEAINSMRPTWITTGTGRCDLAKNRDYFDKALDKFVVGYNFDECGADDTVMAARLVTDDGAVLGTILNYGCHPTCLGPLNTKLSPDYPGAARNAVERVLGGTCMFVLGACGDTAPAEMHTCSVGVADALGEKLGLAGASALVGLPPAGLAKQYAGTLSSGALIGMCEDVAIEASEVATVRATTVTLMLKLRPQESSLQSLKEQEVAAKGRVAAAAADGADDVEQRAVVAALERIQRAISRHPGDTDTMAVRLGIWQMGDIFLISCPGEPYSFLQTELRSRFPKNPIFVSVLANGSLSVSYILPCKLCGMSSYQDQISHLREGALEEIIDACTKQISDWLAC